MELAWERHEIAITEYQINAFDKPLIIHLCVWQGDGSAFKAGYKLLIGKKTIEKALETNNMDNLIQEIYHELGHLTNTFKSKDFYGQGKRDFKSPMFLSMGDEDYKEMHKILYRFLTRELKARCFETTMFIKLNKDKGITIQDVYDNRCSDITMMRNFIKRLENISENGEENDKFNVIRSLYSDCIIDNGYGKSNVTWETKCQKLIFFFTNKLNWLKKRVDKIYYDLTSS